MDGGRDWLKYLGFALIGPGYLDIGPGHVFGPLGIKLVTLEALI